MSHHPAQNQAPSDFVTIPRHLRWSTKSKEEVEKKCEFLKVGGSSGVTKRKLSSAPKMWKKKGTNGASTFEREVYVLKYRIVGSPEDISKALLLSREVSQAEVDAALRDAISVNNYTTTKKVEFDNEVARYNAYKESQAKNPANQVKRQPDTYGLHEAIWFYNNLDQAHEVKKSGSSSSEESSRRAHGKTLEQRMNELGPNQVLDVSNLKAEGTGARAINRPKPNNGRSQKIGVSGLPIVSANYEGYLNAVRLLEGGEAKYAKQLQEFQMIVSSLAGKVKSRAPIVPPTHSLPAAPVASKVGSPTQKSSLPTYGSPPGKGLPSFNAMSR